ncbi:MAG: alpha-glucosidase, partial [bacterium]|nr:alpha-glucosidase [bacterium]
QCYSDGRQWVADGNRSDIEKGAPYVGEVYYGGDRGTTGSYSDFGKKEVRIWWGRQYEYLFETGLEMVWQDMTTPAIRDSRGDMKSFPFNLQVTDNFVKKYAGESAAGSGSSDSPEYLQAAVARIRNLYSYNLHKATYHGLNHLACRKNKRNFIIGRGGFTGMHRFAGLWTGDNASTWDFLHINVAQVLALGISGQAISGQDIGGFEKSNEGGKWADPELLIRWTMAGAFLPWFRNHYIAKGAKEFQEPYRYKDVISQIPEQYRYMYEAVLPVCKHYIGLRYRLMQLFYDAMFENTLSGMPICRPMFLTHHSDDALFNDKVDFLDNQFLVRNDLLVAPVLEKQSFENLDGKRDVYLPYGNDWYCFMDNVQPLSGKITGGSTVHNYDASINLDSRHLRFMVPIYVRAGAVLPTIELEQYVGEYGDKGKFNPVTLNIYPGESGEYVMYLDDGVSRSSAPVKDVSEGGDPQAADEYRDVHITHGYNDDPAQKIRKINLQQNNYEKYDPVKQLNETHGTSYKNFYFVALLHDPAEPKGASGPVKSIRIAGQQTPLLDEGSTDASAGRFYDSDDNAWYYNSSINITFVKVFDRSAVIEIEAEYVTGDT